MKLFMHILFMSEKMAIIPKPKQDLLKNMLDNCSNDVATALSEMTNCKVDVSSTSLDILLLNDVPKLLNPNELTTTVLFMKLKGDINAVILLAAPLKNILKMADIFLHKEPGYFQDLSDENVSVVKEFAHILAGYYITALNSVLRENYELSVPLLSVNPHRAIEEFGFGFVYTENIEILALKASLNVCPEETNCREKINEEIVILFKKNTIKKILRKLKSTKVLLSDSGSISRQ